jgi:hypothetical protein
VFCSFDRADWPEAVVAPREIANAGEMDGFLKTAVRLLERPLVCEGAAIRLEAGEAPRLERTALERCRIDALRCSATSGRPRAPAREPA